jgi:site-specific recombinase XerD
MTKPALHLSKYILGFVDYLRTAKQQHCKEEKQISLNSRAHYYKMLHYCINYAVEILPKWAKDAGIDKHITFHMARHANSSFLL